MKKMLIFITLLWLVFSCSDPNSVELKSKKTKYKFDNLNRIEIVIIDSCEYLYGPWGNATVLTHKGNCKNHKK